MAITIISNKDLKDYKPSIKLNAKMKLFCELYTSFKDECYGNGTKCYMNAYGIKSPPVASSAATILLKKPQVIEYINALLSQEGFNDQNVDKQHLFVINQHNDLPTKMRAITEYNKLKKRVTDRLEVVIPKPIIDIDDDEPNMKHIDKKNAVDVKYDEMPISYDE